MDKESTSPAYLTEMQSLTNKQLADVNHKNDIEWPRTIKEIKVLGPDDIANNYWELLPTTLSLEDIRKFVKVLGSGVWCERITEDRLLIIAKYSIPTGNRRIGWHHQIRRKLGKTYIKQQEENLEISLEYKTYFSPQRIKLRNWWKY